MGNLIEYIRASRDRPFAWGRFDCLAFANECVRLQRGRGFVDEFVTGYTTALGALRRYSAALDRLPEYDSIIDLADERMTRRETLHPAFGWVVAKPITGSLPLGLSFGVVMDANRAAYVDHGGLVLLPHEPGDIFWNAL